MFHHTANKECKEISETCPIGGKILGAGGGGFFLFYASPEKHEDIIRALPELRQTPFRFEPQGSKIIYVEENE
jgi:D-glycero-alpha-D-manno-heptose-7-phosphate kinase